MNLSTFDVGNTFPQMIKNFNDYYDTFYIEMVRMNNSTLSQYIDKYFEILANLSRSTDQVNKVRAAIGITALKQFGYQDFEKLSRLFDRILPQRDQEYIKFTSWCAGVILHHPQEAESRYVTHLFERAIGWIRAYGRRARPLAAAVLLREIFANAGSCVLAFIPNLQDVFWPLVSYPSTQVSKEVADMAAKLTKAVLRYWRSNLDQFLDFFSNLCLNIISNCSNNEVENVFAALTLIEKLINVYSDYFTPLAGTFISLLLNIWDSDPPLLIKNALFKTLAAFASADPKQFLLDINDEILFEKCDELIYEFPKDISGVLCSLSNLIPSLFINNIQNIHEYQSNLLNNQEYDSYFTISISFLKQYPQFQMLIDENNIKNILSSPISDQFKEFIVVIAKKSLGISFKTSSNLNSSSSFEDMAVMSDTSNSYTGFTFNAKQSLFEFLFQKIKETNEQFNYTKIVKLDDSSSIVIVLKLLSELPIEFVKDVSIISDLFVQISSLTTISSCEIRQCVPAALFTISTVMITVLDDFKIEDILQQMIKSAFIDQSSKVRCSYLKVIEDHIVPSLASPDFLNVIQILINDDSYTTRNLSLKILGKLVQYNPIYINAITRKALLDYFYVLQNISNIRQRARIAAILPALIDASSLIVKSYANTFLDILINYLEPSQNSLKYENFIEQNSRNTILIGLIDSLILVATNDPVDVNNRLDVLLPLLCNYLSPTEDHNLTFSILQTLYVLFSPPVSSISIRTKAPELLSVLSSFLYQTRSRKTKMSILKVIGAIGIMEVHQKAPSNNYNSPENIDDDLARQFFHPKRDAISYIDDSLLLDNSKQELYYTIVVASKLLDVFKNPSLKEFYFNCVAALVQILKSPKMDLLPYFDSFTTRLLDVMETASNSELMHYLPLYCQLIDLSEHNTSPFIDRSLHLFFSHFSNNEPILNFEDSSSNSFYLHPNFSHSNFSHSLYSQSTTNQTKLLSEKTINNQNSKQQEQNELNIKLLDLLLAFLRALGDGFAPYASKTVCLLVNCLEYSKTSNYEVSRRILVAFQTLIKFSPDQVFLIVLQVCDSIICEQVLPEIRVIALNTLTEFVCTANIYPYSGSIIRSMLYGFMCQNSQCKNAASHLFYAITQSPSLSLFIPKNIIQNENFRSNEKNISKEQKEQNELTINDICSKDWRFTDLEKFDFIKEVIKNPPISKMQTTQIPRTQSEYSKFYNSNVYTFSEDAIVSHAMTPNLGLEQHLVSWLRSFINIIISNSPCAAIRACSQLSQAYPPFANSIFKSAFHSIWTMKTLKRKTRNIIIETFSELLLASDDYENVAREVLSLLVFMDQVECPLKLPLTSLYKACTHYEQYSYALKLVERVFFHEEAPTRLSFLEDNTDYFPFSKPENNQKNATYSKLVDIYTQLGDWPDAIEIWKSTPHSSDPNSRLKMLVKLKLWDEAEKQYQNYHSITKGPDEFISLIQSMTSLAKWNEVMDDKNFKFMENQTLAVKRKLSVNFAEAAFHLGKWDKLKYILNYAPSNNFRANTLSAIAALHDNDWKTLEEKINCGFQLLASLISNSSSGNLIPQSTILAAQELIEIGEMQQWIQIQSKINSKFSINNYPDFFTAYIQSKQTQSSPSLPSLSAFHSYPTKNSSLHAYTNNGWEDIMKIKEDKENGLKTLTSRKEKIEDVWRERLKTAPRDFSVWFRLIGNRASLVQESFLHDDSLIQFFQLQSFWLGTTIHSNSFNIIFPDFMHSESPSPLQQVCYNIAQYYSGEKASAMANMEKLIPTISGPLKTRSTLFYVSWFLQNNDDTRNILYEALEILKPEVDLKEIFPNDRKLRHKTLTVSNISAPNINFGRINLTLPDPILKELTLNVTHVQILRKWAEINSALANVIRHSENIPETIHRESGIISHHASYSSSDSISKFNLSSNYDTDSIFIHHTSSKSIKVSECTSNAISALVQCCKASASFPDVVHLLDLLFDPENLYEQKNFNLIKELPAKLLLQASPQILVQLNHPNKEIASFVHSLVLELLKKHYSALTYSVIVLTLSRNKTRSQAAKQILEEFNCIEPEILNEIMLIHKTMLRAAVTWYEKASIDISYACNQEDRRQISGMLETLRKLLDRCSFPKCAMHRQFVSQYQSKFEILRSLLDQCSKTNCTRSLLDKIDIWCDEMMNLLNNDISRIHRIQLDAISPELCEKRHFKLAVPGTYKPDHPVIRISYFVGQLSVYMSKQQPKDVLIKGEDGTFYQYLIKGHEDLRVDERIMQFFKLINSLLKKDNNFHSHLLRTMEVIPLSLKHGLVQWVQGTDTVKAIVENYRTLHGIQPQIEYQLLAKYTNPYYDRMQPHQRMCAYMKIFRKVPATDIANFLWIQARSAEMWNEHTKNFAVSNAMNSIIGYVLGLGDRHPSNLLIDRFTGKVVHIDFGDCFEKLMKRAEWPEVVPFRLTRMMIRAMGVNGEKGLFRSTFVDMSRLLRENRSLLLMVLEVFVQEPFVDIEEEEEAQLKKQEKTENGRHGALSKNMIGSIMDGKVQFLNETSEKSISSIEMRNRVKEKLTGTDFEKGVVLSVQEQANRLIESATSIYNLSKMFHGWCPFW